MKTQNSILCTVILAVLFVTPALAQNNQSTQDWSVAFIADEQPAMGPVTPASIVAGKVYTELNGFSRKQWRALQSGIVSDLQATRGETWENAARSVIILSLMYKDKVDFSAASAPLLVTFQSEKEENHCILALAALHLIGDHDTMAFLSQHARQEPSPRIRHLMQAVVADYTGAADYYGRRGSIEVGRPVPIPDK